MRRLVVTLILISLAFSSIGQEFSNRGKEFWVGYGYHQIMTTTNSQDMVLYFSADAAATVIVDIPGIGWTKTYSVAANSVVVSDPMPKTVSQDATLKSEGISSKGIHITSTQPIVAYAHISATPASGATLLFPVNTLGQDYYSVNFKQLSNASNSNSWAYVVATEDNTTVEITPSANAINHNVGIPFTVNLNKGQIYNLLGTVNNFGGPVYSGVDLTGSRIRSVSSSGSSCKKIAVFSGSGRMSITCNGSAPSSDNFIQQVFPSAAWGKKYLTVPTTGLSNNYFRVVVSDPTTVVSVDGSTISGLTNGFYYEFMSNVPKLITSDKPVMVAQYITSAADGGAATCGNNYGDLGDPEMIYLSPIEQTIDTINLYSTPKDAISEHHINVIIKTADIATFKLDGVASSAFVIHPKDATYSYAVFNVGSGQHKLQAGGGFNAIAYGYGYKESYGYNAGTNIKDLYTYISLQNQFTTVNSPVTCVGTNFLFSITLPYLPTSITWDFSGATTSLTPNNNVSITNPVPDSTFIKDGKTLYVFKIPGSYFFSTSGTFPIKIITVNPISGGCSGQQENVFDAVVGPSPSVNFTISHTGCFTNSAQFTDASNGNGHPLNSWLWDFGDATTSNVQNPVKTYTAAGNYNVNLKVVNDIGCSGNATKPFVIEPQPVAGFTISSPICAGVPVTFTDASNISSGAIVKWRWNFGPADSVINNTNAPVIKTFAAGIYTATLVVENSSGCKSVVFTKGFTVAPAPFANFSMPGACLPLDAQFTNLSTIAGGTVTDLTYLWDFGDGGTSAVTNPSHNYINQGPFTVKLTATSLAGCTKDTSIVVSNIYAKTKAGFTYAPLNVCAGDSLTFNDTTKTPGSTISEWHWSFSDGTQSAIKNPGKRFTTNTATATLYIKTAAGCYSDTITKTVTFNQLPTAAFNITGTTCQGQTFTVTDQSVPNSGVITNWYWYFGNGTSASLTNGNPFPRKYDTAGTYTIKLIVKTDKGCKSDTARTTLNVIPAPTVKFGLPYVCEDDLAAVFTDSSFVAGGGTLTYLWNFGDPNATPSNPNTSTAVNGSHHYGVAGTYNVALQVGSATGCSSTLTKPFTVNSRAMADFSFVSTGQFCGNDTVRIKNTSTIATGIITKLEITWDSVNNPLIKVTDTLPPSGRVYGHTYPPAQVATTYKIVVRAFSGQSCMTEKIQSITIDATPKVKFDPVKDFCLNDPSRLLTEATETLSVPGAGVYSGAGITSNGVFNPATAGVGAADIKYLFISNAGCKDSASQNINVIANPIIQLDPVKYALSGGAITLNPVVTGNTGPYLWKPSTYLDNPRSPTPRSTPKADISYHLTVSSPEGCSDTASESIVVLNIPRIPNAFSPNGDGVNDVWEIASLSSYPGCTVDVFNRYGQQVFTSKGYTKPWDGTNKGTKLQTGVYYYIINPGNGIKTFSGHVTIIR